MVHSLPNLPDLIVLVSPLTRIFTRGGQQFRSGGRDQVERVQADQMRHVAVPRLGFREVGRTGGPDIN
jgi:hypothetical protein